MDTLNKQFICPLVNIVLSYLTDLHKCPEDEIFNQKELLKYDPELMIHYVKLFNKIKIFQWNAEYGNLDNMKWLLKKKVRCKDYWTFACSALN